MPSRRARRRRRIRALPDRPTVPVALPEQVRLPIVGRGRWSSEIRFRRREPHCLHSHGEARERHPCPEPHRYPVVAKRRQGTGCSQTVDSMVDGLRESAVPTGIERIKDCATRPARRAGHSWRSPRHSGSPKYGAGGRTKPTLADM